MPLAKLEFTGHRLPRRQDLPHRRIRRLHRHSFVVLQFVLHAGIRAQHVTTAVAALLLRYFGGSRHYHGDKLPAADGRAGLHGSV